MREYIQDLRGQLEPRWWRYGRPAPIWVEYLGVVREFVEKHQLEAIPAEHLVADDPIPVSLPLEELTRRGLWPRPFPGGLRFPHLHIREQIFRLDSGQWKEFSRGVVASFQEKLSRAEAVSFDQLLELSEATAGLA